MSAIISLPTRSAGRFPRQLEAHGLEPLRRARRTTTLQINMGKLCNQACVHCHVEAGPKRTEIMTGETVDQLIALLAASPDVDTVDLTGGAPEMNPHFRRLVQAARAAGRHVMVRCNLTVLHEPGQEDTAAFFAEQGVHVVSSLPCYSEKNVDAQRGGGVFEKSISALQQLNALGYGRPDSGLVLDLVYNPGGAFLPPAQAGLERDYKERLGADFGIVFNQLLCLANMPIKRFDDWLRRRGEQERYWGLLEGAFNPGTVPGLMCRSTVSIGWDGRVYDCDFNQMLELRSEGVAHISQLRSLNEFDGRTIAVDDHCLGCTAGAGSSCGGALA